jgi:sucrose phosphorylase
MNIQDADHQPRTTRWGSTVHNPTPDYYRPLLEIPPQTRERLAAHLEVLYGREKAEVNLSELERILKVYYAHKPQSLIDLEAESDPRERFDQKDIVLITYGDMVLSDQCSPLAALAQLCRENIRDINTLHLLPFFPYSSDRGFSVIDFEEVDPRLGSWQDIWELDEYFHLMFDGVVNHVSAESFWFQEFINGRPRCQDLFIVYESDDELTMRDRERIFRPRTSDVLTKFQTIHGPRYVWTTFSPDQIDLNYKNPEVLLEIIDLLLFYARQGADIIRLDAVTYLWAEPGTSCVHLKQTHEIVKLFRTVLDLVAPHVALITETNVPHRQNISYFGNGRDEAHLVYNFALPPLVLHTFYRQDASYLAQWARELKTESDTAAFFNILDTHDGIGLMGVRGILPQEEINHIIAAAQEHGAYVSYKAGENGTKEPYEINSTWWSAMNREDGSEDPDLQVRRYMASRSIHLVLQGVPAIYFHGGLGTKNAHELVQSTGSKRAVNRKVMTIEEINEMWDDPESHCRRVGEAYGHFNGVRRAQRAFHPQGAQQVIMASPKVFSVLRTSPEGDQHILALTNVTESPQRLELGPPELAVEDSLWVDLLSQQKYETKNGCLSLVLEPYAVLWLQPGEQAS